MIFRESQEWETTHITHYNQTFHPVVGTGISGGITNGIAGGDIVEIRERGVGDLSFEKLTVIFYFSRILSI